MTYLDVQKEFSSFDQYIWQFVGQTPVKNQWKTYQAIPCSSSISDTMSKDLKRRGFFLVDTTICYAFMQATGMVNDHTTNCFRYRPINKLS